MAKPKNTKSRHCRCKRCDATERPSHTKEAYPAEKPPNDAPEAWKKEVSDKEFGKVKNTCIHELSNLDKWIDERHEEAQGRLYGNEKKHRDYKQFKRPTGYWLKVFQGLENTGTLYPIYLALMRCLTPWNLGNVDGSCGGGHCPCVDPTDNATMRNAMEANGAFVPSYINYDAMFKLGFAVMNGRYVCPVTADGQFHCPPLRKWEAEVTVKILEIVFRFCNGTKTPIFVFNVMGTSSNYDWVFEPLAEAAASSDFIEVCASGTHLSNLSTRRWFAKSVSWQTEWDQIYHVSREMHKLSGALADFNARFDLETGSTLVECWRGMKYLLPDMSEHKSEMQLHEEEKQRKDEEKKREAEERKQRKAEKKKREDEEKKQRKAEEKQRKDEKKKREDEEKKKRKAEKRKRAAEERKREVLELRNGRERRVADAMKMYQEGRTQSKKQKKII